MKLDYAFLADCAQVLEDGRIFVLAGNIDMIHAERFPVTHPQVTLVVRLVLTPEECGRPHMLDAFFTAPTGEEIAPHVHSEFTAKAHAPHPERGGSLAATLAFYQTTFHAAGDYLAHVVVDGTELGRVPLELFRRPHRGPNS